MTGSELMVGLANFAYTVHVLTFEASLKNILVKQKE